MKHQIAFFVAVLVLASMLAFQGMSPAMAGSLAGPSFQVLDTDPPDHPVRLIFIHHSCGENWLRDDYGGLGLALSENNYFVSDTNYGWGPDSIGDNTDIPNWLDWFASERTPVYTQALYNESGQNSEYTRLFNDPGGENTVIMFKSCFPNSALEGDPNDDPDPDGWLSVGHAKYVYNQILTYFSSHPDKLFIVVTAPPLSDGEYARNTRAFNNWLVYDWLGENNYTLDNVAVFDFYNVLTARDAHHWYNNGQIEHITTNKNTLSYPSGDDHPSAQGSQKATAEYIPLLNIYYNRWAASGNAQLPVVTNAPPSSDDDSSSNSGSSGNGVPLPPEVVLSVEDFESGAGWEANWDASTASTVTCYADQGTGINGSASLLMDFSIAPGSWGNCHLAYESPQDWSDGVMLSFHVRSEEQDLPFTIAVYTGTWESPETYHMYLTTSSIDYDGYIEFIALWGDLLRVAWEENGGTPFSSTNQVIGLSFGLENDQDQTYQGRIWFDDITVQKSPDYGSGSNGGTDGNESGNEGGDGDDSNPASSLPCLGGTLLPILIFAFAFFIRRR